jgi:hypothetical protein
VVSGFIPGVQSGEVLAAGFTSDASLPLAHVWLPIDTEGPGGLLPNVFLMSTTAQSAPGFVIAQLARDFGVPDPSGPAIFGFGCAAAPCPMLIKGDSYWIVAVQPKPNSAEVWAETTLESVPTPFDYNLTDSTGGPWKSTSTNPIFSGPGLAFAVDAVVPEPQTFSLAALGVILLAVGRWRSTYLR